MPPELHQYVSIDTLKDIIFSDPSSQFRIDDKQHFFYLEKDLHALGVQSILVEKEYIDTDYQEDYSFHYSKCFNQAYSPKCRRLHLFNKTYE